MAVLLSMLYTVAARSAALEKVVRAQANLPWSGLVIAYMPAGGTRCALRRALVAAFAAEATSATTSRATTTASTMAVAIASEATTTAVATTTSTAEAALTVSTTTSGSLDRLEAVIRIGRGGRVSGGRSLQPS